MAKNTQKPISAAFAALEAIGGFGTGKVVPRTVEWDGKSLELHFIDLPGGKVQELLRKGIDADPELVAAALCDPDGSPAMDIDQANALKLPLRQAIVREAMYIFGFTPKAKIEAKKD